MIDFTPKLLQAVVTAPPTKMAPFPYSLMLSAARVSSSPPPRHPGKPSVSDIQFGNFKNSDFLFLNWGYWALWAIHHWIASILGGSWVDIRGVISPLIWVVRIATLLITLLITTHEPPSRAQHP